MGQVFLDLPQSTPYCISTWSLVLGDIYFLASLNCIIYLESICIWVFNAESKSWKIVRHVYVWLSAFVAHLKLLQHLIGYAAKSLQSCPTLCDPIDGSPPGSPVPGILQTRTLEWVAISFSNAWKWKVKVKLLSRVRLFATPWTAAYQAPPSMGFSRQEYCTPI